MEKNKIDISIVQPGTTLDLKTAMKQHDNIASLMEKMPGRIYGMANPNPHLPSDTYRKELERCIKELGFVGVKINTLAHAINPNQHASRKIFELALELEIPVMVHTGDGIPWALPSSLIPIAMDFPDLKIIMAHGGGSMFSSEALLTARLCPNVFIETSWLPALIIREFCKTIGANRIMFGSDIGNNVPFELAKYFGLGISNEELEWCLHKTASKVFRISIK
jgi:predicted TIM-barrel fold metal-dependent hydrolase